MTADTWRNIVYSSSHEAVIEGYQTPDIDATPGFEDIFARTRNYTKTSKEVTFSIYQAEFYVARRGFPMTSWNAEYGEKATHSWSMRRARALGRITAKLAPLNCNSF